MLLIGPDIFVVELGEFIGIPLHRGFLILCLLFNFSSSQCSIQSLHVDNTIVYTLYLLQLPVVISDFFFEKNLLYM